ncbi:MAG: hypothetical protein ACXADL_17765, partial [Candidatus Thorarchaeota archaeon]
MANKIIINAAPPKPSKRIIGGSNQRSKARFNLQGSYGWSFNHAPVDSNESENALWWKDQAERYTVPLSSSGDILYTRQSVKREVQRETDRGRIYNINAEIDNPIHGGSNQPFNKKYHLGDKIIGAFDTELDISDTLYPNTKKRVTFGVTIDGITYNSEQTVPFSLFSSSISTGYQSFLASSGVTGVAFNNLHDDRVQAYQGGIPMQGPFTERFVGGLLSRHNAALRLTERQESFVLTMGPVASVASTTLTIAPTADPEATFDTESITVTINSITYAATFDFFTNIADSTKSLI